MDTLIGLIRARARGLRGGLSRSCVATHWTISNRKLSREKPGSETALGMSNIDDRVGLWRCNNLYGSQHTVIFRISLPCYVIIIL